MQHDKILILDFGSQVTQLIARRVREAHVLSEVHPCDVTDEWVREYAADGHLKGVILSGSHASVYEETTDKAPQAVFDLGVPVLGICYGMQTMAHQLGGKVEGVSDPEAKRKIIGGEFVTVFKQEAAKLKAGGGGHKGATFLAQGTIYPDVIESGGAKSKKAVTIKSHHNVGGLPEQLGLKLLEPLRDLFKDEVRELGVALGLPPEMVYRHPFPGPGLGVRILGEVKKEYADLLRRADAIFIEELRNFTDEATGKTWYDLTSQAFTVFLPVKSVGVMGDGRTYDYVVALRAVQTSDFMTADWAELPYALLKKVSGRIINEVRGINRVTYDVSSKPPATIEWE